MRPLAQRTLCVYGNSCDRGHLHYTPLFYTYLNMNFHIISLTLICALILTSCGSTKENINLVGYSGKGFEMQVPKNWIFKPNTELPKPKNGTIAAAWTSSDISSGFANNMLILKDTLAKDADPKMTSRKYAVINQALTTGSYKEYTQLSDKTLKFSDGDEGLAIVFEAKYNAQTPKQKFIQVAKLCERDVYLINIGLSLSNSTTDKYMEVLSSFTCTK